MPNTTGRIDARVPARIHEIPQTTPVQRCMSKGVYSVKMSIAHWAAIGTVALAAVGMLAYGTGVFASANGLHANHGPAWGSRTLSGLAARIARGSNDASPSAVYYVSTRGAANDAVSGDRVDSAGMPVYLVVMHGNFSNPVWASVPPGSHPLFGDTIYAVVNHANGGVVDVGMFKKSARQGAAIAHLGPAHPLPVVP